MELSPDLELVAWPHERLECIWSTGSEIENLTPCEDLLFSNWARVWSILERDTGTDDTGVVKKNHSIRSEKLIQMPEGRFCLKNSRCTIDHHESRVMVWVHCCLGYELTRKCICIVTFCEHNGREYTRSHFVVNIFSFFPLCESTRCVSCGA